MILLGNKQNSLILLVFFHFLGWRSPYIILVSAPPGLLLSVASSNLVGRKSKCYLILRFSLLLSIKLCWREIRPDAGKTTENEFVASFL